MKRIPKQIIKWKKDAKSDFEKSEIIRLTQMIEELYKINQEVLDIADYISSRTQGNLKVTTNNHKVKNNIYIISLKLAVMFENWCN